MLKLIILHIYGGRMANAKYSYVDKRPFGALTEIWKGHGSREGHLERLTKFGKGTGQER